ncbi:hypothetical protein VNO78_01886 [Psophocarpus tetragonolobus]|uniref:Uncharacterized protein n=1 Tax=Psophocarpus tetragonolobus TaxID=3891 RepID=A0AAN9XUW1_PSOTE
MPARTTTLLPRRCHTTVTQLSPSCCITATHRLFRSHKEKKRAPATLITTLCPTIAPPPHHTASQLPHHRCTTIAMVSLALTRRKTPSSHVKHHITHPVATSPLHCCCTTFVNRHRLYLTLRRRKMCISHTTQLSHRCHLAMLITTPLSSPTALVSLLELNDTSSRRLNSGVLSSLHKTLKHRFHIARLHSLLSSLQPITLTLFLVARLLPLTITSFLNFEIFMIWDYSFF